MAGRSGTYGAVNGHGGSGELNGFYDIKVLYPHRVLSRLKMP
jgi:hypothetical protein